MWHRLSSCPSRSPSSTPIPKQPEGLRPPRGIPPECPACPRATCTCCTTRRPFLPARARAWPFLASRCRSANHTRRATCSAARAHSTLSSFSTAARCSRTRERTASSRLSLPAPLLDAPTSGAPWQGMPCLMGAVVCLVRRAAQRRSDPLRQTGGPRRSEPMRL